MLPRTNFYLRFLFCILACLAFTQQRLRAASRDVLACSTDKAVFVAQVRSVANAIDHTTSLQTSIYRRVLGGDVKFLKLITLSGRVTALAGQSDEAIALLDDGQWMSIWPDGNPLGPEIPDAHILTIAGGDSLWAIAVSTAPTTMPTTSPTTSPTTATASTQVPNPTTTIGADRSSLNLFHLTNSRWERVCELPSAIDTTSSDDLSLAISNGTPTVAVASFAGVHSFTWQNDRWTAGAVARAGHLPNDFRLLECGAPAIVWLSDGDGQWLSRSGNDQPLSNDNAGPNAMRSATCVAEAVRVFSESDPKASPGSDKFSDKLYEQAFGLDGKPLSKRAELAIGAGAVANDFEGWISTLLTVVVAVLLVSSAWRRPVAATAAGTVVTSEVVAPLAPQGYRLLAGLLDLIPVWIAIGIEVLFVDLPTNLTDMPTVTQMLPFYVGVAVYLVLTTAGELIGGRSAGKWVCGLRVVQADGGALTRSAIVIRNALRLIDIFLAWIPLAMILISPLRQRFGDVAARTIVVQDALMIPTTDVEPEA